MKKKKKKDKQKERWGLLFWPHLLFKFTLYLNLKIYMY